MNSAPLVLDEFDHKLLELLQQDASATLSELGDAIGLLAQDRPLSAQVLPKSTGPGRWAD